MIFQESAGKKRKEETRTNAVFMRVLAEAVRFELTCPCGQPHFECGSL